MNNNARLIVAQGPTGAFKSVNVVTSVKRANEYPTVVQVTQAQAAAQPGVFPTLCVGATGTDAAFDDNQLPTVFVSGYTAPN